MKLRYLLPLVVCLFVGAPKAKADVVITNIPHAEEFLAADYLLGLTNGAGGVTRLISGTVLESFITNTLPTYWWPLSRGNTLSNSFGILTNNFNIVSNNFAILTNSYGILSNNFAVLTNSFGVLSNNFAVVSNNFALLTNSFGVLSNTVNLLSNYVNVATNTVPANTNGPVGWIPFTNATGVYRIPVYQ